MKRSVILYDTEWTVGVTVYQYGVGLQDRGLIPENFQSNTHLNHEKDWEPEGYFWTSEIFAQDCCMRV